MRIQEDTLPDRGVKVHDLIRSREEWRGIFLRVRDGLLEQIKEGLEQILSSGGYLPPRHDGDIIWAKGQYDSMTIKEIERYLNSLGNSFKREPMVAEGGYDDFLDDRWLDKMKKY